MVGCDIGKNDMKNKNIIEKIKEKSNELTNTYKNVKKLASENALYNSVLEDYNEYYDNIIDERQKQYDAFKVISEHLDKLIMNTDGLNNKAYLMKEDQYNILQKLGDIREEMKTILDK